MKLNDIFSLEQYDEAYAYIQENPNYTIRENETSDGERQFQIVEIPQPTQEKLNAMEVSRLKQYLMSTDYVVIKIAEGVATAEEYAEVLAERARTRERINELQ